MADGPVDFSGSTHRGFRPPPTALTGQPLVSPAQTVGNMNLESRPELVMLEISATLAGYHLIQRRHHFSNLAELARHDPPSMYDVMDDAQCHGFFHRATGNGPAGHGSLPVFHFPFEVLEHVKRTLTRSPPPDGRPLPDNRGQNKLKLSCCLRVNCLSAHLARQRSTLVDALDGLHVLHQRCNADVSFPCRSCIISALR